MPEIVVEHPILGLAAVRDAELCSEHRNRDVKLVHGCVLAHGELEHFLELRQEATARFAELHLQRSEQASDPAARRLFG